jgi:hypothetical protein
MCFNNIRQHYSATIWSGGGMAGQGPLFLNIVTCKLSH